MELKEKILIYEKNILSPKCVLKLESEHKKKMRKNDLNFIYFSKIILLLHKRLTFTRDESY